jgi:NAD-dependent deacetylase
MIDIPKSLINELNKAQHIVVLTGSGTSAESGVPTFREAQTGLWSKYNPEELATPQAFQSNPQLVWDWYQWRRRLILAADPNPGHYALARMAMLFQKFTLITQNVDGLHQRAGIEDVIELHGNIMKNKCFDCEAIVNLNIEETSCPPRCPECNGLIRPGVVWFGENLPVNQLTLAVNAAQKCDLFFSVGTSALVHPAASLPITAIHAGVKVIEINTNSTPLTPLASEVLCGPAGEILPKLVDKLLQPHRVLSNQPKV